MKISKTRTSLLLGVSSALCIFTLTFVVPATATPGIGAGKKIGACVKNHNGKVRLVSNAHWCYENEYFVSWNKRGRKGSAGADGATGPQGPAGVDGADGATGPQGPSGNEGADGATGPQGPAGNDGADGVAGPQGPAGSDGATGPQGPAGNDGADGATGPQGPAGNDGADGATGPQGPAGNDGAEGSPGTASLSTYVNSVSGLGPTFPNGEEILFAQCPSEHILVGGGCFIQNGAVGYSLSGAIPYTDPGTKHYECRIMCVNASGCGAGFIEAYAICLDGLQR